MFDYAGSLDGVLLDASLWLCVALPWLGALFALRTLLVKGAKEVQAARGLARQVACGASAASVAILLVALIRLASAAPEARRSLAHGWTLLRLGSLDINATLVLDALSGALALAAAVGGTLWIWRASLTSDADVRRLGAGSAALGAVLLGILSDDLVVALIGGALAHATIVAAFTAEAGGRPAASGFAAGRLSELCLLAALGLTAWGLGGTWATGEYLPGFRPRLVAVLDGVTTPAEAKSGPSVPTDANGRLTFTSLPGANVRIGSAVLCAVDGDGNDGGVGVVSRPCRRVATSPFVDLPVPAAVHEAVVVSGPGTYDLAVEGLRLRPGVSASLVLMGPTTSLAALSEQMRLRDGAGGFPMRAELSNKRVLGASLALWVSVLLALATLLQVVSFRATSDDEDDASAAEATLVLGGHFVLIAIVSRAGFVAAFDVAATTAMVLVLGVSFVWLVLRASFAPTTPRALTSLGAASVLVGVICVLAGAPVQGAMHVAISGLGLFGMSLASRLPRLTVPPDRAASATPLFVCAQIAAGAPLPFLGASLTVEGGVRGLAALDSGVVPGALLGGVLALGFAGSAFAVWRIAFIAARGRAAVSGGLLADRMALASAVVAGVLAVLASSGPVLGQFEQTLLAWWVPQVVVAPPTQPLLGDVALGFLALTAVSGLVGFLLARRRYTQEAWADRERQRLGGQLLTGSRRGADRALGGLDALAGVVGRLRDGISDPPALVVEAPSTMAPPAAREEVPVEAQPAPEKPPAELPKRSRKAKRRGSR